jgi:hypothetical protein
MRGLPRSPTPLHLAEELCACAWEAGLAASHVVRVMSLACSRGHRELSWPFKGGGCGLVGDPGAPGMSVVADLAGHR